MSNQEYTPSAEFTAAYGKAAKAEHNRKVELMHSGAWDSPIFATWEPFDVVETAIQMTDAVLAGVL